MMSLCGRTGLYLWIFLLSLGYDTRAFAHQGEAHTGEGGGAMLKKGASSTSFTFEHQKWDELGHRNAHLLHEGGRDIHNFDHEESYYFSFGHGVTDDIQIDLTIPIVDKTFLRVEDGVVGQGDSSTGTGDLKVSGKFRVYEGPIDVIALGGVKFPTGNTADRGFDGKKLEPEEVPGTGSFDYSFGGAVNKQFGRWFLSGGVIYILKTEGAQGRENGNVLQFDLSSSVSVREPDKFPNVQISGGVTAQHLSQDEGRSGKILDSGGEALFIKPGISINLNRKTTVFFSTSIPAYQNRGGQHPEIDYGLTAGVSMLWE